MHGTLHKDNGTTIINVLSKFSCLSYIHGKDGIAAQARTRWVMLLSRQGYLTLKSTLRNKGASPTFPTHCGPDEGSLVQKPPTNCLPVPCEASVNPLQSFGAFSTPHRNDRSACGSTGMFFEIYDSGIHR